MADGPLGKAENLLGFARREVQAVTGGPCPILPLDKWDDKALLCVWYLGHCLGTDSFFILAALDHTYADITVIL